MIDCSVSSLLTKPCSHSRQGGWTNTGQTIKEQLTAKLTYCIEQFWAKLSHMYVPQLLSKVLFCCAINLKNKTMDEY